MSSTINRCFYDPSGKKNFQPIAQPGRLQKSGDLDISSLVQEIVTQDFGYTGSSRFNLVLRDKKMVLKLMDSGKKVDTLKFEDGRWSSNKRPTVNLTHTSTSSRYNETLMRIRSATTRAPDPSIPLDKEKEDAFVEGRPGTDFNQLQDTLRDLTKALNDLQRKIETSKIPRDSGLDRAVDSLEECVRNLHTTSQQLKSQNASLLGLQEPLERIAHEVPQAMREINFTLDQIRGLLARFGHHPRQEHLEEVVRDIGNIRKEMHSLGEISQRMEQENQRLREENASLKDQLSLKDRKITELKKQREHLEKTATTYKQRNEGLEDELEELRAIPVQDETSLQKIRELEDLLEKNAAAYIALEAHSKQRDADQERYLIKQRADLDRLQDELERMRPVAERSSALEEENQHLRSGALVAKRVVEEDAKRMAAMQKEIDESKIYQGLIERENGRLKEQLEEAEKAKRVATVALRDLQSSAQRTEQQLAAEKVRSAQLKTAAEKSSQKLNETLGELQLVQDQKEESELQIASLKSQLRQQENASAELEALRQVSNELIKAQDEEIARLRQEMEEHQRRGISDGLLQKQLAEKTKQLEEEVRKRHDVEAQIATLTRGKQQLEGQLEAEIIERKAAEAKAATLQREKQTKTQIIDLRSAPPLPEADDVVQEAASLAKTFKAMKDETIPAARIGSLIANRALLEGVTTQNLDKWMEETFPDQMGKKQTISNQITSQPHESPLKPDPITIIRTITNANLNFAALMREIKALPQPLTLNSIFGMRNAYIVQDLFRYERTVGPLLKAYRGKENKEVEKARKLLEVVQTLKETLLDTLRQTTFKKN